ncbi:hypothetical protein EXIGLDRAFT_764230 [Exidia glandulosa HHB12029]|uniref:Uncharacterized protein n=1 Tax=Exidia glandulosa HHB12029 TaxID=1314781 RepID=A0A166B3G1_EXIGL|nr:hypothetical protein EXIGLDRAFT_764230 [Exidia glandulosa HHB12029]
MSISAAFDAIFTASASRVPPLPVHAVARLFNEYICLAIVAFQLILVVGPVPGIIVTIASSASVRSMKLVLWSFHLQHPDAQAPVYECCFRGVDAAFRAWRDVHASLLDRH